MEVPVCVRGAATVLALASALACAHALAPAPPSSASHLLGAPAPGFRRPTIQGGTFDTRATAGQVVVVDFFAAYCAPCRRSLPALEALHRRRADLTVVGISVDETAEGAGSMVARYRLTFPVVHDGGAALAGRFRVAELPASFVVDRAGAVVWAGGGDQPEGALADAALAILRGEGAGRAPRAGEIDGEPRR